MKTLDQLKQEIARSATAFDVGGFRPLDTLVMAMGYEFVFQISTNEKANLNVVDNGSFMFARNAESGDWSIYYDFY